MRTFLNFDFVLCLVFLTSIQFGVQAQGVDHIQGEIMFTLSPQQEPSILNRSLANYSSQAIAVEYEQIAAQPLNAWLMKFDHNIVNEINLLDFVNRIPEIHVAQFNHIVKRRQIPNDEEFNNQWQYINTGNNTGVAGVDLDMDLAWDIATGGVTAQGDTIVVCVIDDGVDLEHEDLKENLWRNYAEIPNNGIDDDNNGYIDDYLGWNSKDDTDNVQEDDHGTSVSGIIGAKGNNGIGVSGVNWDVKIMTVNAIPSPESGIVAAYSYVWTQRKRYNDSNGAEGAFVVATNSSFGLGVPAEEVPIWCSFYDQMGEIGIISAGATSNSGIDVDVAGDVPSNCTSDYLVVVTNMLWNDEKRNAAGYGATSVDLGAYGQNVFTTFRGNSYSSSFGGTSAATPHVAGVAALLYSMECDALVTEAKNNPPGAALAVKNYLLNGVIPNESLEGITTTGGKLNARNTMQLGVNACSDCPAPIAFSVENDSPFSLALNWTAVESANSYNVRYREIGSNNWITFDNVNAPFTIENLLACNLYEAQIQTNCSGETSDFGIIQNMMTTGCCELPESFTAIAEGSDLIFDWASDAFTSSYKLEYRLQGEGNWIEEEVSGNQFTLTEVPLCQTYEARIQSLCADFNSVSDISEIILATSECGSCTGTGYCTFDNGPDNGSEWIDSISVGDLHFNSGQDLNGYGNYLGGATTTLKRGSTVEVYLSPEYTSTIYDEYFTIWIDWNNDEQFDEEEELAFDPGTTTDTAIEGSFFVPETANLGNTRMRVIMSFESKQGPCDPGNPFRFGEVEDYCVDVTNANSTEDLFEGLEITLLNNPVQDILSFNILSESSLDLKLQLYTTDGKIVKSNLWKTVNGPSTQAIDISHLMSGVYIANISDGTKSSSYKVIKL